MQRVLQFFAMSVLLAVLQLTPAHAGFVKFDQVNWVPCEPRTYENSSGGYWSRTSEHTVSFFVNSIQLSFGLDDAPVSVQPLTWGFASQTGEGGLLGGSALLLSASYNVWQLGEDFRRTLASDIDRYGTWGMGPYYVYYSNYLGMSLNASYLPTGVYGETVPHDNDRDLFFDSGYSPLLGEDFRRTLTWNRETHTGTLRFDAVNPVPDASATMPLLACSLIGLALVRRRIQG